MADFPPHGHPTLVRCEQTINVRGVELACPAYLNHDGQGGLYCPGTHWDTNAALGEIFLGLRSGEIVPK